MPIESLPIVKPDSYVPLRVQVYEILAEAILSNQLRPGEHLGEDRMCAQLGVSRSPVREALHRLEADRLVSIQPRHGAVVTEITREDLADLASVSKALEGQAAALAAERIADEELNELLSLCRAMESRIEAGDLHEFLHLNSRFHDLIFEASGNRWLRSFEASLSAHTRRAYDSATELPSRAPEALVEHRALLEALRLRDADEAERLAKHHVDRATEAALAFLRRADGQAR
jgi:DNA-binding GntR family transcriptional regulator